ncbi:hypothetical protein SAY87_029021 [Trapa incisa]|uniref:LIM zinc-binding domain-containing protein n=1 Tax=Trapa incisa TaxID=236973 RepID=A0AAN7QPU7_9MYRT|nr:hypothetical protein SAY87_029021 [Trapa incisa]
MGWWTKIAKGSGHRTHRGRYGANTHLEEPGNSMDDLTDIEREEIERAIALSLSEEDHKGKNVIEEEDDHIEMNVEVTETNAEDNDHIRSQLEEDEELAKAIQESLILESPPRPSPTPAPVPVPAPAAQPPPPRYGSGNSFLPYPLFSSSGYRICAGCNTEIGHGRFLSCMGSVWHPECFCCHACKLPIIDYEFSISERRPYHKSCYKEHHHPKCDVCMSFIPTNPVGLIEYRAHPFWLQKYCPSHERDRTPRCCSCERMEPRDTKYLSLDDGRKLCLECLDSAVMDTHECQPLYVEIQEFYEGLNMKVGQQIPLLLVERQALNEAMEGEKNGHHHLPETRGLCLSEEQLVTTIMQRPRIGAGNRIIEMVTEPYRLVRRCEVTAILILFGLPRLLTGSILVHELMHAWLRLNGYPNLSPEVEEGICQVLAHMWLDSELYSSSGSEAASSSSPSSSSSSPSSANSSKKGRRSGLEKKLGEYFKYQIETDTSKAYGEGFRLGNRAVLKFGLRVTLEHIRLTGSFPL